MSHLHNFVADLAKRSDTDTRTHDRETIGKLISRCFKPQADFASDRSRMISARCPRRSGKSYGCLVRIVRTALERPKSNILYLCLTRGQASRNLWSYFKEFNVEFELRCKFHETNLIITFPNGSKVSFAGAETRQEIDKLRGQAFDLVVIDECKSFAGRVLEELIWEVLKPALNDRLGTLVMIGTPGNILAGPFYEATTLDSGKIRPFSSKTTHKGKYIWSFHKWGVQDNVAMPHLWDEALADKAARGWVDEDPVWRREYLGEWCPSESLMVYRYGADRNRWIPDGDGAFGLPEGHEWKYILGMDIGFNDSTALVVAAYADTHPNLFHVWDFKQPHLTVDAIERAVRSAINKFGEFFAMVADTGGLGKTIVESLGERGLHFDPAEKREKFDYIELVNSDLLSGRIQVLADSYLESEMQLLQWKDDTYKHEDKGTDNHACDAFLYLFRHALHHFWQKKQDAAPFGSQEWAEMRDNLAFEQAIERRKSAEGGNLDVVNDIYLDGQWIH